MSVVKKIGSLLFVLLLLSSCRNYESEEYREQEDLAYEQLISEFTSLTDLPKYNGLGASKPALYVLSELDNEVKVRPEYAEIFDDPDNHYAYRKELEQKIIEEYKHFKPLLNGRLDIRHLTETIAHDSLYVKLISRKEYELLTAEGLNSEFVKKPGFFGYVFLSRIVFNRDYTIGYLNYMFYCGVGCFWSNNAEIRKKGGKWTVTKHYSGGIA